MRAVRLIKALHKQEQGYVLVALVFIIFSCAALVAIPLMDYMSTGVTRVNNEVQHTKEVYSAEAGVWDAVWKIQRIVPGLPQTADNASLEYALSGNLNGSSVDVSISLHDWETYRIHSVATNLATGHKGTIDSDIVIDIFGGVDLTEFTKQAVTSPGGIAAKNNVNIYGDVWTGPSGNMTGGNLYGDIILDPITGWPTEEYLKMFFLRQVDTANPYSESIFDISNPELSGHLYAHGYPNGNYVISGTGELSGVIYVDGDLYFDQGSSVSLMSNTIFVTGDISFATQANLLGPGAVIALGNITFSPSTAPAYLFVMSVNGWVNFLPQGDFLGSCAGEDYVNMQPGGDFTWDHPGVGDLNLPGLYNIISGSNTWKIY